jgi:L-aspartate oxidase
VVCGRGIAAHLRRVTLAVAGAPRIPSRGRADATWLPAGPAIDRIRRIVTAGAGVLREAEGLRRALDELRPHLDDDAGLVGHLLVRAALDRTESRGAHTRTDFPEAAEPRHTVVREPHLEGSAA